MIDRSTPRLIRGVITVEEMRRTEEMSERMGVSRLLLMENAGRAVVEHLRRTFNLSSKRIVVVAGTGNNGGDGFVAARHLTGEGSHIHVILLGREVDIRTAEARTNLSIVKGMKSSIIFTETGEESWIETAKRALAEADIIVDAIFGTGVKGEVRDPHRTMIGLINSARAYVVAVDIPSGLDPDAGTHTGVVVEADTTVTFHRPKKGLPGNQAFTGEVIVAPIGVPPEAEQ